MKKNRVKTFVILAIIVIVLLLFFSKRARDVARIIVPGSDIVLDLGDSVPANSYVIPAMNVPSVNGVTVPPYMGDKDEGCCCAGGSAPDAILSTWRMDPLIQAPRLPAYVPPPASPTYYNAPSPAEVITFSGNEFNGMVATWARDNPALRTNSMTGTFNWNDRINSIRVVRGRWNFYEHANYQGRVATLGPGTYNIMSLLARGLRGNISSFREAY